MINRSSCPYYFFFLISHFCFFFSSSSSSSSFPFPSSLLFFILLFFFLGVFYRSLLSRYSPDPYERHSNIFFFCCVILPILIFNLKFFFSQFSYLSSNFNYHSHFHKHYILVILSHSYVYRNIFRTRLLLNYTNQ